MYSALFIEMLSQQIHPERIAAAERNRMMEMLAQHPGCDQTQPVLPPVRLRWVRNFASGGDRWMRPRWVLPGWYLRRRGVQF
jgi:hypothetical protein